jgi:hypothetical protein
MPRCQNGHEQALGLKCAACGARLSYREACADLVSLPKVSPAYGKASLLFVGLPSFRASVDYSGVMLLGDAKAQTADSFTAEKTHGGTWFELYAAASGDLRRWLSLVAFDGSQCRFVVVDTTNPLSVTAVASLPPAKRTTIIAVTADEDSTPIEQNTSYVALSVALQRNFSLLVFTQGFVRDMLLLPEGRSFVTQTEAFSRIVASLIERSDDVTEFMERDLSLGVKLHLVTQIVSGSSRIYGKPGNVFAAQSYQLDIKPKDLRTVYSLVSCNKGAGPDFEKGFSQFRSRRFKVALSAECRVREETGSELFDVFTAYGVADVRLLKSLEKGYGEVAKRVPQLKVESVA